MSGIWIKVCVNSMLTDWTSTLTEPQFSAWIKGSLAMKQTGRGGVTSLKSYMTLLAKCGVDWRSIEGVIDASEGHWSIANNTLTIDNFTLYQPDPGAKFRKAEQREREANVTVTPKVTTTVRENTVRDIEDNPPVVDKPQIQHPPYAGIQLAWNTQAAKHGLPQCRDLTDKRKTAIRQRWNNPAWREEWAKALVLVKDRPFLLGQNDRGWKVDFDFFVKSDTVTKILEGKYAGGMSAKQEREYYADKQAARRNEPPPPKHPLIIRLETMMKGGQQPYLTAVDGGQKWRAYAIDKDVVLLTAVVSGKDTPKRVQADALTQFTEFQDKEN